MLTDGSLVYAACARWESMYFDSLDPRSERQHRAHIELTHKPTISERSQQLAQEMVLLAVFYMFSVGCLLNAGCCLLSIVYCL